MESGGKPLLVFLYLAAYTLIVTVDTMEFSSQSVNEFSGFPMPMLDSMEMSSMYANLSGFTIPEESFDSQPIFYSTQNSAVLDY